MHSKIFRFAFISERHAKGDRNLRKDIEGIKNPFSDLYRVKDERSSGNQKITAERLESEERIGKNERQQRKRKNARLSEIDEGKNDVTDEVRVIKDGDQRHRVQTGAKDNGRDDQCGNGGSSAHSKMNLSSRAVLILKIDAQEISGLRHTEKDQPRNTPLNGQKYEKKVRTDRAEKTELCEKPRARAVRHDGTKHTGRDDTNVRKKRKLDVVHEVNNRQFKYRKEHGRGDQLFFILEWGISLGHDFSCGA